jgi:hypothetical protein
MFNLAPTLRALTAGSPITTAMYQARRMAQRFLERGGAVVSAKAGSSGFVVPADVDAAALAKAIEAKLRAGPPAASERHSGRRDVPQRKPDGQLFVSQAVLEQLGGGNAARGVRFLERLIDEMRRKRVDG